MKGLYEFMKNKNRISYTLQKAYDMGFSDSDAYCRYKSLKKLQKMKTHITTTYMNNKIVYSEINIDFMQIIPYLNNISRMNEIIENFTVQYLFNKKVMDDMFEDYLIEQMQKKKLIFINVCIYNYNTERCDEDEAVHGTTMIFVPNKEKYDLYYINSHGYDMKDSKEFHIIKTKTRCKIFKYNNVIDFIFLKRFADYFNMKHDNILNYEKDKHYNYWGANFQGGDTHGICFVFPYIFYYNMCKYYTQKKELLDGTIVDKFSTLMLSGNINRLVHSCFVEFMNGIDDIDNTDAIDNMVVKMGYRFIKKVSNSFISYISQPCFQ